MWRETPAPYGPLFLWIGQGISALTGENIVVAVLCHRLVVLLGVGLIVWATPRLARRCGVAEVSALWLGAANPLLIMHLVAGIHNEALMLGPDAGGHGVRAARRRRRHARCCRNRWPGRRLATSGPDGDRWRCCCSASC